MLRIFLIGFGHVGRALIQLLVQKNHLQLINDDGFAFTAITTRNHGNLYNPQGLNLESALNCYQQKGTFNVLCKDFTEASVDELLALGQFDVLVELSPLTLSDRANACTQRLEQALQMGKHVVTANKGPVAFHYLKLKQLAQKNHKQFLFESTVMDGSPVFSLFRNHFQYAKIKAFSGVLNSTTNFLLTEMEKGNNFELALQKARALGMVEADPQIDLQGWDAALKTAILCNVFFNEQIDPLTIQKDSFNLVSSNMISQAQKEHKRLKFIAHGFQEGGEIKAKVKLTAVGPDEPFYFVNGSSSLLKIDFLNLASFTLFEENPSIADTAFGVLLDLVEIAKR